MHARRRLFGHANNLRGFPRVPRWIFGELGADRRKQATLFFARGRSNQRRVLFCFLAKVHQERGVTAVVENHVRAFAVGTFGTKVENAMRVVPVVGERFAFDREHRRAVVRNCGGRVILCRVNIARSPSHFGAKRFQRFDQNRSLDRHVQRARDACASQWLRFREFFANGHQAGHFGFRNLDFFVAPGRQ